MKTISINKKEKYELKAKQNGYKILDMDVYHAKEMKEGLIVLLFMIIYLTLGIVMGVGIMVS